MWIVIEEGVPFKEGDEMWCLGGWSKTSNAYEARGLARRRNLTGWEAVEYALRQEVLGNDVEGCQTTPLFWDCECEKDYITPYSEFGTCARCGANDSRQPDSRIAEVIMKLISGRS